MLAVCWLRGLLVCAGVLEVELLDSLLFFLGQLRLCDPVSEVT